MKPETAPLHATIAATADLHLIRTRPDEPSPLLCHECRLGSSPTRPFRHVNRGHRLCRPAP